MRVFSFIGVAIFLLVLVFRKGHEEHFQSLTELDKEAEVASSLRKKVDSSVDFWEHNSMNLNNN